ncbi:MAG TPA: acyl-CoA dehydrogenase family protein [Nocardioidaceae bacterium]|nr:acyl-CoA dehydrogenase family protein [Nocardioidaceae bacterium]
MSATSLRHVELPAGTRELRDEVRRFLDRTEFEPSVDSWVRGFDRNFSRLLGQQGWIGMTWPSTYGGAERSALDRFVVNEELLAAGAPVAAHWLADRQIGPGILRYGSEHLRGRYLARITTGELALAAGLSEPDAGSDLAAVRTKAVRADGGWRISGRKIWTSGAHLADGILVLCRTGAAGENRHEGLSQLMVELPAPGVEIRPLPGLDGETHFSEVTFDDTFVPDTHIVGRIGDGWRQITAELALERSGAERFLSNFVLLDRYFDHGCRRDRVVTGAVSRLRLLRQASLAVAELLDQGDRPETEAALVKDAGTTFEQLLAEDVLTHADVVPDPESDDDLSRLLAQAVVRAPTSTIRGGSSDILRGMVARGLGLR